MTTKTKQTKNLITLRGKTGSENSDEYLLRRSPPFICGKPPVCWSVLVCDNDPKVPNETGPANGTPKNKQQGKKKHHHYYYVNKVDNLFII